MKWLSCFLALSVLHGLAVAQELPTSSPGDVGLSLDKLNAAAAIVQAAVDKNQSAGVVVMVLRHGKIAWTDVAGKLDMGSATPMRADAVFRIYSMTKPVTSVAAMMLVEQGKLNLDDNVSKYLPDFKDLRVYSGKGETVAANREVTIRDLMRHTSGLTYGTPGGSAVDQLYIDARLGDTGGLADLVHGLGKLPLLYQPGTKFNYSLSTDVLGRIVEVVSGRPLDAFFKEHIFKPLDMRDTAFMVPDNKLDRFATCYSSDFKGSLKPSDLPATSRFRKKPPLLSGGGGLVSTARDYARFCQMLLNGGELNGKRLLLPETIHEMTMNQLPAVALPMTLGGFTLPGLGFGLGFSVWMTTSGPRAGEFGWGGAASTSFWVSPKTDMAVIVMQQIVPLDSRMQIALPPAIYAAVEK